ncbi:MAG TPA: ATP-binding protein [Spirochaetota bacterium]|nr:ATP-binding protein [Spirochaetota bacterium]
MLIDFTVKNFRSIKDEQTLSLVASDSAGDLLDNRIVVPGENFRLLPSAIIYGANASGKSNLVRAIQEFKLMIMYSHKLSKDQKLFFFDPFRLDKQTSINPSEFEIEFIAGDSIRYLYNVKYSEKEIIHESLFYYPKKQKTKLYIRNQGKGIDFGVQLKGHKKQVENILLSNQLYLSVAVNNNLSQLNSVYQFFSEYLVTVFSSNSWSHIDVLLSNMIIPSGAFLAENQGLKNEVKKYLQIADIDIDDIILKEREVTSDPYKDWDLPQDVIANLNKSLKYVTYLRHHLVDDGGYVDFNINDESDGTQRLFQLSQAIIPLLNKGGVLIMDEIDQSLHTMLSEFIISEFNNPERNPRGAQLIATTHDISLMKPENFRRDQVWFTEKEKSGATRLYSLDEYDKDKVRGNTPFNKLYLEGRFDAIPRINRSLLQGKE